MTNVWFDPKVDDDNRRGGIYAGDIYVHARSAAILELGQVARSMLEAAFPGMDPRRAQHELPVEQFARVLAELKPRFIHHPDCKRIIHRLLQDLGCDLEQTYFDVPRLRSSTSDGYLTTGIAYAFHPHRDTWYSAPFCQINWWLPVYEIEPSNAMAFHVNHWRQGVKNGSAKYNYQDWVTNSRYAAAAQIGKDTREQPHAEEPLQFEPALTVMVPVGGVMLFSAAQLHSTIPNSSGVTRYSIDFRTVHLGDARAARGAPNVDSFCTGTTMGDYLRGTDYAHLPEDVIRQYWEGHPQRIAKTA
jgi:hypothetical protein